MASSELCVRDLMQFLPDFRELLDISEIVFSLLSKSTIRLDQGTVLTSGEKVERLTKLLQAVDTSPAKPSGVHHFLKALRETGKEKNIKGHGQLWEKIIEVFPEITEDYEVSSSSLSSSDQSNEGEGDGVLRMSDYQNRGQMPPATHQMSAPPFSRPLPRPPSSSHRHRSKQITRQSSSDETDIYEGIHPAKPPSRPVASNINADEEEGEYEVLPEELKSLSMSLPPLPPPKRPLIPKSDSEEEEEEEGYQPLVPTYCDTEQDIESEKNPAESHDAGTSGLETESAAESQLSSLYIDQNDLDNQLVELVNSQPSKPIDVAPVINGLDKSPSDKSNDFDDYLVFVDNDAKETDDDKKDVDDNDQDSDLDDGRELTTSLLNNSVSEAVVTELLQSIISERESIVKTVELQKSHLQHELTKTHELEIKELHLKYKSRFKKLKLKYLEDGLALKAVIENLQSELAGVYEQNSKLTRYMKESYKREEKFNKAITRLQQTASGLESDLATTRSRENDLLTNIQVLKEKLRKYELT